MLQLIAENTGNSDPVIPVRWCVSPDIIAKLHDDGIAHPHLLLSVWNGKKETMRKCVPLEQAMEYVEFTHPGANVVNAAILMNNENPRKLQHDVLKAMRPYTWDNMFSPGEMQMRFKPVDGGIAHLEVSVPAEFFAHEPPAWERQWVNLAYSNDPRDQCDYRKRRIFAYTLQIPLFLFWLVLTTVLRTVVVLLTFLIGARGARPKAILHPFANDFGDVWEDPGEAIGDSLERWLNPKNNFFGPDVLGNPRPFGFRLLHPLLFCLYGLEIWFLHWLPLQLMISIGDILRHISGTAFVAIIIFGLVKLVTDLVDWNGASKRREERAKTVRIEGRLALYNETFGDVVCMPSLRPDIRTLTRPTMTLRFKALKAKVCRPYRAA